MQHLPAIPCYWRSIEVMTRSGTRMSESWEWRSQSLPGIDWIFRGFPVSTLLIRLMLHAQHRSCRLLPFRYPCGSCDQVRVHTQLCLTYVCLDLPLCKLAMFPLFDIAFLKSQSATPTFAGWALNETWQKTFCSGQVQKFFTLARTTTWLPSFSTPCPLQLVRSAPWFASLRVLPCLSQSRDSDLPADPAVWSSDLESHLWRFQTKRVLGSVTFVQSIIFPSAFAKEMWPALVTWTVHWSHCLTIGTWRPVLIPSVHPASNCSTYQASYHRRPDKWSSTEHYLATGIVFVAAEVD